MLIKAVPNTNKECERCKETHYIPEDKKFCVPCMVKNINEEKQYK